MLNVGVQLEWDLKAAASTFHHLKDMQREGDDDIQDCVLSPEEEATLACMKGVMYSNMDNNCKTNNWRRFTN